MKDDLDCLADHLHQRIMNITAYPPVGIRNPSNEDMAYKKGHRDARHAAAELVLRTLSEFKENRK